MTMSERMYVPTRVFAPEEPCPCRSGKTFGECCGSLAPDRGPPAGVTVIERFLSRKDCNNFIRFAEKQQRRPLQVYDAANSTREKFAAKHGSDRRTMTIELGKREAMLNEWVARACTEILQPRLGRRVEWFEVPYVLRYGPGDLYIPHADAEQFDAETQRWYRAVDRDVSILMYFNEDFEGGGLQFGKFNYLYRHRAGDLVFFPSTHSYLHESRPVISGRKYALASWGVVTGSPRVNMAPFKRVLL